MPDEELGWISRRREPATDNFPSIRLSYPQNIIDLDDENEDNAGSSIPTADPRTPITPLLTAGIRDLRLRMDRPVDKTDAFTRERATYTKRKREYDDDNDDDSLKEISEHQFKKFFNRSQKPFQTLSSLQVRESRNSGTAFIHCAETTPTSSLPAFPGLTDVIDLDTNDESRRLSTVTISSQASSGLNLVDDSDSEDEVAFVRTRTISKRKNAYPMILDPLTTGLPSATQNGVEYQAGSFIEFKDGTFMKVKTIYHDKTHGSLLIGAMFTRVGVRNPSMPTRRDATEWKVNDKDNELDTRLPLYHEGYELVNELIQNIRVGYSEDKADYGLWRRPIRDVLRHRELQMTNGNYDNNCLTAKDKLYSRDLDDAGPLTCRWKDIITHDEYGKWKEQRLERVPQIDADETRKANDNDLRDSWSPRPILKNQPYSFADGFCRAGGVSFGAKQAGLSIEYAFDCDEKKIFTHKINFTSCRSFVMDVSNFISWAKQQRFHVTILHLSPPCQPFSIANTTPNEAKNERNQPPLLGISEVIKCLKPRIVTVEEAPGIVSRHSEWFFALLNQFTDIGFSLRWTNLKCSDFGVPQQRRRFFIIAAAPGETLPPFPEPTHGPGDCSIQRTLDELNHIGQSHPLTHHEQTLFAAPKPRYDANRLAKTITTSGGDNYHPSGLRPFSVRELATLQTFPWNLEFGVGRDGRQFAVVEKRLQVGNAVPPAVYEAVARRIVRSLRESDERRVVVRRAGAEGTVMVD